MKLNRNRFGFVAIGLVASLAVGGAASAADAPAIEWKVSDGGNGHWYQFVRDQGNSCWGYAKLKAEELGGHLATLTSPEESQFVGSQLASGAWYFLGGYQDHNAPDFSEPAGGWRWVTGEPWTPLWDDTQPENGGGNQDTVSIYKNSRFHDVAQCEEQSGGWRYYVIEWSADCNGDGVVDYGQIQSGELADTNNNGVPDVCELVITSVKPVSGASTGGTAVRINGNNFPISPIVTFGGVTATDIVRVSPSLITAVTPAGTPGMTMVAVNSASSESFYYRPSCDGDLDNNGTIDSADLGLVLLGFGSCGDSAAVAPQQPEPMIFQTTQTATPVLNKK